MSRSLDPNNLTVREMIALNDLARRWEIAHGEKDYTTADRLRAELMAWGAWPITGQWHPWFESGEHRTARLAARVEGDVEMPRKPKTLGLGDKGYEGPFAPMHP
jgi:hypothetical protein